MIKIDYRFLKKNHKFIHAFGLGFIQIKLSDTQRVHIYTDEVKNTTHQEEIHDHRYNFKSEVIKGTLTNKIYSVIPGDDYVLTEENCSGNKQLKIKEPTPCSIKLLNSVVMSQGTTYFMDKDTLHRVETNRCITFLDREETKKDLATIIYPKEVSLICPFSVNLDEDALWSIVKKEIEDAY